MSVSVTNTDANVSGKTLVIAENAQTITGLQTFDRDPSAPFAVSASSSVVSNLDADMLDGAHYAVSTWTPVLGGSGGTSGQSYSAQSGTYVKIGRLVMFAGSFVLTAEGTITGNLQIQGLPFTVGSASGDRGHCHIGFFGSMDGNVVYIGGLPTQSATTIDIYGTTAAASATSAFTAANVTNTTTMNFGGFYFTA